MDNRETQKQGHQYQSIETVFNIVKKQFDINSPSDPQMAFFTKFNGEFPGHLDAYNLCALAKDFPRSLIKDNNVIAASEMTIAGSSSDRGWSDDIINFRDQLELFVIFQHKRLINKAKNNLGLI